MSALIPPEAVGAGAGMVSEYANTDLMGADAGLGDDLTLGRRVVELWHGLDSQMGR